jgi:hypothetical protein
MPVLIDIAPQRAVRVAASAASGNAYTWGGRS